MLTKADLKSIDTIVKKRVREEVEAEGENIRDNLSSRVIESRLSISSDIRDLADRVKNLEVRSKRSEKATESIKKDLNTIKKDLKRIEGKIDKSVDFIDRSYLKVKSQVERIEKHLHLDTASL